MFNFDKKTLYIILGTILLLNVLTGGMDIVSFIYTLPGVIVAMTFHEFAHAWMAYKLGDETPKLQGRINLNPLTHIDPVGMIFLLIAGFGWGKPVEINSKNFDGKHSISKAEAIVAAAGPIMNFIVAFIFMIISILLDKYMVNVTKWCIILQSITASIVLVNLGLGIFNLIPIYPLDGSKILMHFLPYNAKQWMYEKQSMLTIILFIIIFFTNIISYLTILTFNGIYILSNLLLGLFI